MRGHFYALCQRWLHLVPTFIAHIMFSSKASLFCASAYHSPKPLEKASINQHGVKRGIIVCQRAIADAIVKEGGANF